MKKYILNLVFGSLLAISAVPVMAQQAESTIEAKSTQTDKPAVIIQKSVDKTADELEQTADELVKKLDDEVKIEIKKTLSELSDEDREELVGVIKNLSNLSEKVKDGEIDIDVGGIGFGEAMVAVTAIVLSLGMPIIIVFLILFFSHRKRRQKMELVNSYLNSNQPVPEHVMAEFNQDNSSLRSGIQLIGLGIGLCIALSLLTDEYGIGAIGLIPLFMGIARVLSWKFDTKGSANKNR